MDIKKDIIKVHKVNSNQYHFYNIDTKKHLLATDREYKLWKKADKDFLAYLCNLDFNKVDKKRWNTISFGVNRIYLIKKNWLLYLEKTYYLFLFLVSIFFCCEIKNFDISIKEINFFDYFVISIFSMWLHEIGHFVYMSNRNIYVPEIGIKIWYFLPFPSMFVDSTGSQFLKKYEKINMYYSGIFVNLFVFLLSTDIHLLTKINLFLEISNINLMLILLNGIWFINQDGKGIIHTFCDNKINKRHYKAMEIIFCIMLVYSFIYSGK